MNYQPFNRTFVMHAVGQGKLFCLGRGEGDQAFLSRGPGHRAVFVGDVQATGGCSIVLISPKTGI